MDTSSQYREIPIDRIEESADNPRKTVDDGALQELADSIRARGILSPVIVRPIGDHYELIAGCRRVRAARLVGLDFVPALVRERPDAEVLDDAITENLQRENVTPLEEAKAFERALERRDPTRTRVERVMAIAQAIGKSPTYVWDRLKLVDLIPDAQALLERGLITVRHAVPLARLNPDQQTRAIAPPSGYNGSSGLFTRDSGFEFHDVVSMGPTTTKDRWAGLKAVSVREFESWIAKYVRFRPETAAAAAPLDFGPVAEQVATAAAQPGRGKKVVQITHDSYVAPEAKVDGERTYCGASWKRADGERGSKTCDKSVLGVIVVGPEYGHAYQVCVNKDCDVHWKAEKREREKRQASARGESPTAAAKRREAEEQKARDRQAKEQEARKTWDRKKPVIAAAMAVAVGKAKPLGLADLVLGTLEHTYDGATRKAAEKHLGAVKTVDDLVRHAAVIVVLRELSSWNAHETFAKFARRFGVDVAALLAGEEPKAMKAAAKTSGKKR